MSDFAVRVVVDDRARLVMAALAASDWPGQEQLQAPHAVHQHSKQTRQQVLPYAEHKAVAMLNQALAAGVALDALFSTALHSSWPGMDLISALEEHQGYVEWLAALASFHTDAGLQDFWDRHTEFWKTAKRELSDVFAGSQMIAFLSQLDARAAAQTFLVVPCIVYPMLSPVLVRAEQGVYLMLPPAKAWGESPPWPFGEDPGWVIAQSCWMLTELFMAEAIAPHDLSGQALLRHAAVTLCLEQDFDEAEAMAYLVRTKKEQGLPKLPMVVEMLRTHLEDPKGAPLADIIR